MSVGSAALMKPYRDLVVITALDVPLVRTNWAENIILPTTTATAPMPAMIDRSPSGTTQGDRKHEVYLEAGTWQGHLVYQRNTGYGTCEVLIGPTSMGSIATAGTANHLITALGTQVTLTQSGVRIVTIRKTTLTGQVDFIALYLRRTA